MNLPRIAVTLKIILGNILLIGLIVLISFFIPNSVLSIINLSISSIIYFTTTLYVLAATIKVNQTNGQHNLMFLSRSMGLVRVVLGIVWIVILKNHFDQLSPWNAVEFILIYIYYSVVDVYYLDKIFRRKEPI